MGFNVFDKRFIPKGLARVSGAPQRPGLIFIFLLVGDRDVLWLATGDRDVLNCHWAYFIPLHQYDIVRIRHPEYLDFSPTLVRCANQRIPAS